MKKIVAIITIILFLICIEKVYAEEPTTYSYLQEPVLYSYNVDIKYDVKKEILKVRETFLTKNSVPKILFIKKNSNFATDLNTNLEIINDSGSEYQFYLKSNDEYFIEYKVRCKKNNCNFDYDFIKSQNNTDLIDSIKIKVSSIDNEKLPNYEIVNASSFNVVKGSSVINATSNRINDFRKFSFSFQKYNDELLEEYDNKADAILIFLIGIFVVINFGIFLVYFYKYKKVDKELKKSSFSNDNEEILKYWKEEEYKRINNKILFKLFIFVVLSSLLIELGVFIILFSNNPVIDVNITGVTMYFGFILLLTGSISFFSFYIYSEYKEAVVSKNIKYGTLYTYKKYNINDNKIVVKEKINGESKTFTSKKIKNNIDNSKEVFLLYVDDKHYYVNLYNKKNTN